MMMEHYTMFIRERNEKRINVTCILLCSSCGKNILSVNEMRVLLQEIQK